MMTYATHPWSGEVEGDPSIKVKLDGDDVFVPDASDQGEICHFTI